MPSPFPGMDPYLENPVLWPAVHHGLISEMMADLNRQLRPRYFANLEERIYVSDEDDPGREYVVPDVHLVAHRQPLPKGERSRGPGVATIEPLEVTTVVEDEIHEARIEIVDTRNRAVVTVIELLSPTNKLKGSYGRESYQNKRRQVLSSQSHLIEIDLLRAGTRIYIRESTPAYDYLVHVSRADGTILRSARIWPIPIHAPLPVIPVPLTDGDTDAQLDLQQLLQTVYDRGAFDLKIDYTREPIPGLAVEHMEWSRSLIANRPEV